MSIDRDALFKQIYIPLGGKELLQCGPMVPGPFCNGDEFTNSYDPAAAEALLTENGWTKGADGFSVAPTTTILTFIFVGCSWDKVASKTAR